MPDDAQRISKVLNLMDRRLSRLEETAGREDAVVNPLRSATDRGGGQDATSQATASPSKFTWDSGFWDSNTWS